MRRTLSILSLLAALPAPAFAQDTASDPAFALKKWDAASTVGLLVSGSRDLNNSDIYDHETTVAWNFDVGRYWTTHLKTDFGVMLSHPRHYYTWDTIIVPGASQPTIAITQIDARPTALSGAATYQFLENSFVHPYVSGGVRVTWVAEERYRQQYSSTLNRIPYTVPGVDDERTLVLARPFLAAGCKSYFNQRAFMKPEVLIAVGPHGFSHATLRIGAGVDF